jgi:hypothetical protein
MKLALEFGRWIKLPTSFLGDAQKRFKQASIDQLKAAALDRHRKAVGLRPSVSPRKRHQDPDERETAVPDSASGAAAQLDASSGVRLDQSIEGKNRPGTEDAMPTSTDSEMRAHASSISPQPSFRTGSPPRSSHRKLSPSRSLRTSPTAHGRLPGDDSGGERTAAFGEIQAHARGGSPSTAFGTSRSMVTPPSHRSAGDGTSRVSSPHLASARLGGRLPAGWRKSYDTRSGYAYYIDDVNRRTQWERPLFDAILTPPNVPTEDPQSVGEVQEVSSAGHEQQHEQQGPQEPQATTESARKPLVPAVTATTPTSRGGKSPPRGKTSRSRSAGARSTSHVPYNHSRQRQAQQLARYKEFLLGMG